jgi:uncharacterized membrane protein YccC
MKKTQEISSFFYSQYFDEGLRITLGCIIPVVICAFLGEFLTGTFISLGALIVGIADTPGAPAHRRAGATVCVVLGTLTIIVTALANNSVAAMTIVIAALGFIYSMFAVFNSRASTIGTMCLLIMLINVDHTYSFREEISFISYFIIGGAWYMLISFSTTYVRPYRLAQQVLAETVQHVADYIRIKANFYDIRQDIDTNYGKLIDQHIEVNNYQENVRDILFQSKRSIKDTTSKGRFLTLVFADIVDLFEQSMTTHYDYATIQDKYGESDLLKRVNGILHKVASELDNISYKLQVNKTPQMRFDINKDIEELRNALEKYDRENDVNSIPIKKIIVNIRTMARHIQQIYNYCQLKKVDIEREEIANTRKFINEDIINLRIFRDNLSLSSNTFRHALRMSIVLSGTYLILNLINFSEFGIYWVLLTILVILKPGFGLTQERNLQRLIGTIIGGIIGAIIIILIPDQSIRFGILIVFFFIAYSLFRVNYIMAVIFMTPYVLIMLSFTGANTLEIAKERIFDTFIGGMIAFLSSYVIFPNWESFQIKKNMRSLLVANYRYLAQAISILSGQQIGVTEYKLARKEVYIATANMGSTFQRLLTEPKWRQTITKEVNRFVILNHIFSSYSATLMTQLNESANQYFTNEDVRLFYKALQNLEKAISTLDDESTDFIPVKGINEIQDSNPDSDDAIIITEQLQFLVKISADLQKVTAELLQKHEEEEREKRRLLD